MPFYSTNLDKFLLKVFNKFLHNYKVSKLMMTRFLLGLSNLYIPNALIKKINIFILKAKFLLLIFGLYYNTTNDVVYINNRKVRLYLIFRYYSHKDLCFLQVFL